VSAVEKRRVRIRVTECGHWAWCCTFCYPPRHGKTLTWARTMRSVANHFRHVSGHHEWVGRNVRRLGLL
jgi:hypothetical protein